MPRFNMPELPPTVAGKISFFTYKAMSAFLVAGILMLLSENGLATPRTVTKALTAFILLGSVSFIVAVLVESWLTD